MRTLLPCELGFETEASAPARPNEESPALKEGAAKTLLKLLKNWGARKGFRVGKNKSWKQYLEEILDGAKGDGFQLATKAKELGLPADTSLVLLFENWPTLLKREKNIQEIQWIKTYHIEPAYQRGDQVKVGNRETEIIKVHPKEGLVAAA